jgi:hypothetical protein
MLPPGSRRIGMTRAAAQSWSFSPGLTLSITARRPMAELAVDVRLDDRRLVLAELAEDDHAGAREHAPVELPRVVDERAAASAEVRADVHAARSQSFLGHEAIGGPERGGCRPVRRLPRPRSHRGPRASGRV